MCLNKFDNLLYKEQCMDKGILHRITGHLVCVFNILFVIAWLFCGYDILPLLNCYHRSILMGVVIKKKKNLFLKLCKGWMYCISDK